MPEGYHRAALNRAVAVALPAHFHKVVPNMAAVAPEHLHMADRTEAAVAAVLPTLLHKVVPNMAAVAPEHLRMADRTEAAVAAVLPELLHKVVPDMEVVAQEHLRMADRQAERLSVVRTQAAAARFQLVKELLEPLPHHRQVASLHKAVLIPDQYISHRKKCRNESLPE